MRLSRKKINVSKQRVNLRQSASVHCFQSVLPVYTPELISVVFRQRNIASDYDNERIKETTTVIERKHCSLATSYYASFHSSCSTKLFYFSTSCDVY